jgi:hypothetical protein
MNLKNQRWIFSVALVWTVELVFPPSGNASTYGRVTNTEWRPIWDMGATLNTPFLLIEMLVSGLLVYGAWVMFATRTPKEKPTKQESVKSEKLDKARPETVNADSPDKSSALLEKFQATIDYNWSVAKLWTVKEDVELVSSLKHLFGENWEPHYRQLRIPNHGEMYSGESLQQPNSVSARKVVATQTPLSAKDHSNKARYKPVNIGLFFAIMGLLSGLMVFTSANDSRNQSSPEELFSTWFLCTCALAIFFTIKLWWGDNARRMSQDRGMGDAFWAGVILGVWASLFLWMFPRTKLARQRTETVGRHVAPKPITGSRMCAACNCLLSPTMTSCPRCEAATPLTSDNVTCSRCNEVFPRAEGACPVCSEGLAYVVD